MEAKIGIVGQGRNIESDLKLILCKAELAEYTVILANQETINKLKSGIKTPSNKMIFVNGQLENNQCAVVTDEKLKHSILSGKGLIKKCSEMELLNLKPN